jgi:glycosyltransferase involved in cell wall biosynthesis
MRIAVVHNRYRLPGGEDAVVERELELLATFGHEPRLFSMDNTSIGREGLGLAARTIWSRPAAAALDRFLEESPYDLLHVHNTFPLISPSVYSVAGRKKLPVVQTLHNFRLLCPSATFFRDGRTCTDCLGRFIPWPAVRHACYRDDLRATAVVAAMLTAHRARGTWSQDIDAYVALTGFARRMFAAGGIPEERIHVRPNFVPEPDGRCAEMRSDQGGAVFVGRLSEEKGVRLLLEAWRDVPVPLSILGDGPLGDELRSAAPSHVEFLGHVSHSRVLETLSRAAFAVVPSTCFEGFPMAVLDAFSLGVPVLAAGLGSLEEIVEDGTNGRLFTSDDARDLAEKARALAAAPAERLRLGAAARAAYQSHYTPKKAITSLERIYEHAIDSRGRRAAD